MKESERGKATPKKNWFCFSGVGIDGNTSEEVVLVKKPGKVKALEDEILSQIDHLNFDLVHNVHCGISHTRYSILSFNNYK